jgi:hypothetical protein
LIRLAKLLPRLEELARVVIVVEKAGTPEAQVFQGVLVCSTDEPVLAKAFVVQKMRNHLIHLRTDIRACIGSVFKDEYLNGKDVECHGEVDMIGLKLERVWDYACVTDKVLH